MVARSRSFHRSLSACLRRRLPYAVAHAGCNGMTPSFTAERRMRGRFPRLRHRGANVERIDNRAGAPVMRLTMPEPIERRTPGVHVLRRFRARVVQSLKRRFQSISMMERGICELRMATRRFLPVSFQVSFWYAAVSTRSWRAYAPLCGFDHASNAGRMPTFLFALCFSQRARVRTNVGTPPSSCGHCGRDSSSYSIIQRLKPFGLSATIQTSS